MSDGGAAVVAAGAAAVAQAIKASGVIGGSVAAALARGSGCREIDLDSPVAAEHGTMQDSGAGAPPSEPLRSPGNLLALLRFPD